MKIKVTLDPSDNLTLEWYQKYGDEFMGKEVLLNITKKKLVEIFSTYATQDGILHFADSYPVTQTMAAFLQPFVQHIIDTDKYDYFVIALSGKY